MLTARIDRLTTALLLSALVVLAWFLFAADALAQAGGTAAAGFSCNDGRASGNLYDSGPECPLTLQMDNIFRFLICRMEKLSSDLMGNMYCGMIKELVPMVMGVLTLSTVIFGIGFTIGVIPATAREFQKFLIKVVFVYVFATQAEYLIGFGYRFLVEGAREGIAVALSGLFAESGGAGAATSGADIYASLDKFLGRSIQFAVENVGKDPDVDTTWCQNAVFAVMAIMAVAFPALFFVAIAIIFRVTLTFLRAVFGYCYAIIGIAFLLSLAPFFLSFYLFMQTRQFFDKWLGYLVAFSLQMVLVFAFLAFVVSIDVKHISGGLVDIIVPVEETRETTALRLPWRYCTLCDFKVVVTDEHGSSREIAENEYDQFLRQGSLQCRDNPPKPIKALDATSPETGKAPDQRIQNALLKFTVTGMISLLVLAYIVESLLAMVPSMAHALATGMGASYAPQLGGGTNPRHVPTTEIPLLGNSIETFEQRFYEGYRDEVKKGGSNAFSASSAGFTRGAGAVFGGNGRDPGMIRNFTGWLVNPHRDVE